MALPRGVTDIRVLGLEQAKRNLDTLSGKLQKQIVRQAARAAVNVMAKAIKAGTYGGRRVRRTGLMGLAQSVATRVRPDEVGAAVKMRRMNIAAGTKGSKFFGPARPGAKPKKRTPFYWWFLEKGTVRIAARPWVVPSFDSKVSETLAVFEKRLAERLDEECRQLPKTGA